jgi:choline dehydrogenase-like flavoprotein
MGYDDIIVGTGSSGAASAARLTEDPGRQELLLEAGPDYPTLELTPPAILNHIRGHTRTYEGQISKSDPRRRLRASSELVGHGGL